MKKLSLLASCLGLVTMGAQANEVLLTANQPMKIEYAIAHKNNHGQVILGELRSLQLDKSMKVNMGLDHYDLGGLVIVSIGGHVLPATANQFDQPNQCSMTTDKNKTMGALEFTLSKHNVSCRTYGGVFG